jgi:hypothetical protein
MGITFGQALLVFGGLLTAVAALSKTTASSSPSPTSSHLATTVVDNCERTRGEVDGPLGAASR